jgi:hypothetical protein
LVLVLVASSPVFAIDLDGHRIAQPSNKGYSGLGSLGSSWGEGLVEWKVFLSSGIPICSDEQLASMVMVMHAQRCFMMAEYGVLFASGVVCCPVQVLNVLSEGSAQAYLFLPAIR